MRKVEILRCFCVKKSKSKRKRILLFLLCYWDAVYRKLIDTVIC